MTFTILDRRPLDRRTLLRSALGATIALPLLDAMMPRVIASDVAVGSSTTPPPQRFVAVCLPNGVNPLTWHPTTTGANYALPATLAPLSVLKPRLSVFSGLSHQRHMQGHPGQDFFLTGAEIYDATKQYRNTISLDQRIVQSIPRVTRFHSLQLLSTGNLEMPGVGRPGHADTLSFDHEGQPMPTQANPKVLFDALFSPETDVAAKSGRLARRQSVLDGLRTQAKALESAISAADRSRERKFSAAARASYLAPFPGATLTD